MQSEKYRCYLNSKNTCLIFVKAECPEDEDEERDWYIKLPPEYGENSELFKMLYPELIPHLDVWKENEPRLDGLRYMVEKDMSLSEWIYADWRYVT